MSQTIVHAGQDTPVFPRFLPEMKSTHKLLVPQMAPLHFRLIIEAFRQEGFDISLMENSGPGVTHEGLQYVHNDACYPALLVIGQFIDALKHGGHDPDHTALVITQTGGGCRASNYIHLLRKALVKAGFPQVPVASINFSNLERNSGLPLTPRVLFKVLAACLYGDALMALSNQTKPYELDKGESDRRIAAWQTEIAALFSRGKGTRTNDMRRVLRAMAEDFAAIPMEKRPTYKVGIVGEIYVKYSPLGNNHLEDFLLREGCEVNIPSLLGFVQYCVANYPLTTEHYGGNALVKGVMYKALDYTIGKENLIREAVAGVGLRPPGAFAEAKRLAGDFIGLGAKMGEGWLLTGEMAELIHSGFPNIVCAQPFGCLPNHVVGRGMIAKLRGAYPQANITSIDYDPSATRVNQENRIRLMLASAEKTM